MNKIFILMLLGIMLAQSAIAQENDFPRPQIDAAQEEELDNILKSFELGNKFGSFGYLTSFSLTMGGFVDEAHNSFDSAGFGVGLGFDKYLLAFPYIGAGLNFTYNAIGCGDVADGECDTDVTANVLDFGVRVIARYPINWLELYAAMGVSYIIFDTSTWLEQSNTWHTYKDNFINTSIEAGITLWFVGFRYRHYIPKAGLSGSSYDIFLKVGW